MLQEKRGEMGEQKEEAQEPKKKFSVDETLKRKGIDLKKMEEEQVKLAKQLRFKDAIDFSQAERIGACENVSFKNKVISAIVVCDAECNIIEQKYFAGIADFPYVSGFRAYRELPAMIACFHELSEKPDVMFIHGHGAIHPRLGLASHFSIASGIPSIGVADGLIAGEANGEDVMLNGKKAGKVLASKQGSRPMYISPGNLISAETAFDIAKRFIKLPHKLPEPLHLAHRYAKEILKILIDTSRK